MPDREYPIGAVKALIPYTGRPNETFALDALAAMSPEDRAALARWVWPEGEKAATRDMERTEAATLQRVAEFLRWPVDGDAEFEGWMATAADRIEGKFGGSPYANEGDEGCARCGCRDFSADTDECQRCGLVPPEPVNEFGGPDAVK